MICVPRLVGVSVENTLRCFYRALLEDLDAEAATRWVSPNFHLRPSNAWGVNVNSEDPASVQAGLRYLAERTYDANDVTGASQDLLRQVVDDRGASPRFPFSAWSIESVSISANGQRAHAVTTDASCELELVDDVWLVLWIFA